MRGTWGETSPYRKVDSGGRPSKRSAPALSQEEASDKRVSELCNAVHSLQSHLVEKERDTMAVIRRLELQIAGTERDIAGALSRVESKVASGERERLEALAFAEHNADNGGAGHLADIWDRVAAVTARVDAVEQRVKDASSDADSAISDVYQRVRDATAKLTRKLDGLQQHLFKTVGQFKDKLSRLERTVEVTNAVSLVDRVDALEQIFEQRPFENSEVMRRFEVQVTKVAALSKRIESLERGMPKDVKSLSERQARMEQELASVMKSALGVGQQQAYAFDHPSMHNRLKELEQVVSQAKDSYLERTERRFVRLEAQANSLQNAMQQRESSAGKLESQAAHAAIEARIAEFSSEHHELKEEQKRLVALCGMQEQGMPSLVEQVKTLEEQFHVQYKELCNFMVDVDQDQDELKSDLSQLKTIGDSGAISQLGHIKASIADIQGKIAEIVQEVNDKAASEQVQSLQSAAASIQSQMDVVHKAMHESSNMKQAQQIREELSSLQFKFTGMECALREKAGSVDLQQLSDRMASVQANASARCHEGALETAMTGVRRDIASIERALKGKADIGQTPLFENPGKSEDLNVQIKQTVQQLSSTVGSHDRRFDALEHELREKVGAAQVQQCKRAVDDIGGRVCFIEQSLQEKAGSDECRRVHDIVCGTQAQINTLTEGLGEKISIMQMEEFRASAAGLTSKLGVIETQLSEKAPHNQLQQLWTITNRLETRVVKIELEVQEKASGAVITELRDSLGAVQRKISTLTQERFGVSAMSTFRAQLVGAPRPTGAPLPTSTSLEAVGDTRRKWCRTLNPRVEDSRPQWRQRLAIVAPAGGGDHYDRGDGCTVPQVHCPP